MTFWQDLDRLRALLDGGRRAEAIALLSELRRVAAADSALEPSRRVLLQKITELHHLDRPAVSAPTGPRRLLVSGIGRSGTTLIYQQVAKLLLLETPRINFRYEPYLWNIRTPQAAGNAFGNEQIHHFGLHTHLATPLFLADSHDLHDRFLDTLFAGPADDGSEGAPEAYLTKVIRGTGRLRAYLSRFPDLRIVICLRNPLDTINSSLGMFSFFGEEFHENDRARFRAELEAQGHSTTHLPEAKPHAVEWYGAWWRAFTEESLALARDFPDEVFLFCHEQFQHSRDGVLQALEDFIGLRNPGIRMGLEQSAGPSIRATSLTAHDLWRLRPENDFYRDAVLERFLGAEKAVAFDARLPRKYVSGRFSWPVAGTDAGQRSSIQLRGMMIGGRESPFVRLARGPRSPVRLEELITRHAGERPSPVVDMDGLRSGKRFGAVITCHNNAGTIADAVLSCLNQTLPFDEIVVVDDRSTDDSRDKLHLLAERYSNLTVVPLESSIGPSAARDIGIRRLGTDFVTQLDGDDLFWPTKNAAEAAVLAGDETALAFSDILLVLPETSLVQDTGAYAGASGSDLFARLLSRTPQIPRDMTLPRQLYFEVGGYDLLSHLYEDWDFKLRLAAREGIDWRRASGVAGTVYNRLTPGLSGADPGAHARALVLIFLRALRHGAGDPATLLASFDAALRPFADRHVTRTARDWLDAALQSGRFDPGAIAGLAGARRLQTLDNSALASVFEAEARNAGAAAEPA